MARLAWGFPASTLTEAPRPERAVQVSRALLYPRRRSPMSLHSSFHEHGTVRRRICAQSLATATSMTWESCAG